MTCQISCISLISDRDSVSWFLYSYVTVSRQTYNLLDNLSQRHTQSSFYNSRCEIFREIFHALTTCTTRVRLNDKT